MSHVSDGKSVYFFKGDQYWKYDMSAGALYSGYPTVYGNGTGNWPGIPESLDAAVPQWSDGKSVYLF